MSIKALPQTTVRAIGSTQVLTDSASLVKELIDNALDACATSVFVEISANTLDIVQVRDNGQGIPPEDRDMLARRNCTSKIRDENDLSTIGGTSLGFRGEALSSAAEMGTMTVTTKCDGEDTATILKVGKDGEIAGRERISHAVGTTIRIADFLKAHPVRKQVALKDIPKCLAKIKQTMHAYAFARPATRLSLRVLKASSDKDNWTYAPTSNGTIEDIAMKVVGKACASGCSIVSHVEDGFVLQAFLPRAGADVSKINNVRQYISIDQRPISVARGTPKQMVKIFRDHLKAADGGFEGVKDPFLYLSLTCPAETYDANLEPAKDNVLFADTEKVLGMVKKLFDKAYSTSSTCPRESPAVHPQDNLGEGDSSKDEGDRRQQAFWPNMDEIDQDDLALLNTPLTAAPGDDDDDDVAEPTNISNPWIIAKMHSIGSRSKTTRVRDLHSSTPDSYQAGDQFASSPLLAGDTTMLFPLTPDPSSPLKRLPERGPDESDVRSDGTSNFRPAQTHALTEPPPSSSTVYDRPLPFPHNSSPLEPSAQRGQGRDQQEGLPAPQIWDQNAGTPLSLIPDATQHRRAPKRPSAKQFVNRPFVSPVPNERDAWFDIPEARRLLRPARNNRAPQPVRGGQTLTRGLCGPADEPQPLQRPRNNADIRGYLANSVESNTHVLALLEDTAMHDDISQPMHQHAMPMFRAAEQSFVRASELLRGDDEDEAPTSKTTLPRRRRTSEGRVLVETSGNGGPQNEKDIEIPPCPRRRRTTDRSKMQRSKSSRLPLESVPSHARMQNVMLKRCLLSSTFQSMSHSCEPQDTEVSWNEPAVNARTALGTAPSADTLAEWTRVLRTVLDHTYPRLEMVQDLGSLVRRAVATDEEMLPV